MCHLQSPWWWREWAQTAIANPVGASACECTSLRRSSSRGNKESKLGMQQMTLTFPSNLVFKTLHRSFSVYVSFFYWWKTCFGPVISRLDLDMSPADLKHAYVPLTIAEILYQGALPNTRTEEYVGGYLICSFERAQMIALNFLMRSEQLFWISSKFYT